MYKCDRCGRRLTDPVSIARGIGPECINRSPKDILNVIGYKKATRENFNIVLDDLIRYNKEYSEETDDMNHQIEWIGSDNSLHCVGLSERKNVYGLTEQGFDNESGDIWEPNEKDLPSNPDGTINFERKDLFYDILKNKDLSIRVSEGTEDMRKRLQND